MEITASKEVDPNGSALARYSQGLNTDEILAMLRAGATSYYQADGIGSVTSLSNSTGALAQTYAFDSFGKQTASSGSLANPFQYTGREFDAESSLYFYRARYYDPNAGRFLSEDPARYEFTSFYTYVGENPVLWRDPLGLWKCKEGDCGGFDPGLKSSLDCLEKCAKIGDITVTCGTSSHPPKIKNGTATADPHFYGGAVDIGNNNNPKLSPELFDKCFKACFPQKQPPTRTWGSYAQREYNSNDPDQGWHFHVQYFGGLGNKAGFSPDPIHPHGQ